MKSLLAFLVFALPTAASAQDAAPPSVTLFNTGQVIVRRTFPIHVGASTSSATLPISDIVPGSLTSLDAGLHVNAVMLAAPVDETLLLHHNVGRTFAIDTGQRGTREAVLVGVDPERWRWADAPGVRFGRIGRIVWPAEMVPATVSTGVTWTSDRARESARVMYQTSGASWAASYQLFLGAAGRLEGTAVISSGELELRGADVQLEAGNIGRSAAPAPMAYKSEARMQGNAYAPALAAPDVESIGETHLYTLPGRINFAPGTTFTTELFEPAPARPDRRYILPGALPFYGGFGQMGDEQPIPVSVMYHLDRKLGTTLGDLALPAGSVSIFDTDRGGRMQLIGQGSIAHTSPGNEVLVDAGTAFDVSARRTQLDFSQTRTTATPATPSHNVTTSNYRVVLKNAKDSAVTVEVREDRGGEWSITESSLPAIKRSATRTIFNVPVPARDSAVLTYRVRVIW